jgi:hypothetical protein
VLTIYRRHRKSCKHRAKGRKYRHCECPIWVDGFLASVEIRESLKVRDWQRAQEIIREWEIEDRRSSRPTRKPLSECWQEFLTDIEARQLHDSTTRKYKLLRRQMQGYAENMGIQFIDEFDLSAVGTLGPRGRTVHVQAQRS